MRDPLSRTFELLATTPHARAVEVLIAALDLPDARIATDAAAALVRRNSGRGQMELLARWDRLDGATRAAVEALAPRMGHAVRQCLLRSDEGLRSHALEFVRRTESLEQVPTLLELLMGESGGADAVADTLHYLLNRLYEHTRRTPADLTAGAPARVTPQVRNSVLSSLERALDDFGRLRRNEVVVEGILSLGDPDHFAVRKALNQAAPACRELAAHLLMESRHPGVMQLILDSMGRNYPHPRMFEALRSRTDLEFIGHLLRWFPQRLSQVQQRNFRQIDALAWLGDPPEVELVPAPLQGALAALISATGLPSRQKLRVQEWLIRHGTPEGRLASADVLAALDGEEVEKILHEGLDSDDAEVQAWATAQLRQQHVPQAVTLLLDRLDSPLEAVREAARAELRSFDVHRVLDLIDRLDEAMRLRASEVLQKIDPECVSQLAEELRHPIRRRRIRAARGARALGLHTRLVGPLLALLEDADPVLRRCGIEVLADLPLEPIRESLARRLSDPSPRVREAAEQALRGGAAVSADAATGGDG